MDLQQRAPMRFVRTMQRFDKRQTIDMLGNVRKQIADPSSRLPVLLELPRTLQQIARLSKLDPRLGDRQRLTVQPNQLRLIVKRIDMRWTTMHKYKDHALDLRREMTTNFQARVIAQNRGTLGPLRAQ